jgi:hypothetical protein
MLTFEYEGVKITLKSANARTRMWLNQIRRMYPGYFDLSEDELYYVEEALNCLYLVDQVDGDLGFEVPMNGNTSPTTVKAFVEGFFSADESLYILWANHVRQSRQATNSDPDLLPPHELDDEQKKIPSSKKGEKPNG